jgi:hypothetical protein
MSNYRWMIETKHLNLVIHFVIKLEYMIYLKMAYIYIVETCSMTRV